MKGEPNGAEKEDGSWVAHDTSEERTVYIDLNMLDSGQLPGGGGQVEMCPGSGLDWNTTCLEDQMTLKGLMVHIIYGVIREPGIWPLFHGSFGP